MSLRPAAFVFGAVVLTSFAAIVAAATRRPRLPVVPRLDLPRYMGTWFEIARLETRYERQCVSDTHARYSLRPDGTVHVLNSCRRADGSWARVEGTARIADPATRARLKVTFFWPFAGDYDVLHVDPAYRVALVGEPSRRNLWLLAREPELDEGTIAMLLARAAALGFDVARIVRTPHTRARRERA